MEPEELFQLLRLLKQLGDDPSLYCPLKELVRRVSNGILRHADDIVRPR